MVVTAIFEGLAGSDSDIDAVRVLKVQKIEDVLMAFLRSSKSRKN